MDNGAHSLLAPSSAERWVFCSGSVRLAAQYPGEENEDSLWGQAAHSVGQGTLQGQPLAVGSMAPNGVVVTDEMVEAARMYTDDVFAEVGHLFSVPGVVFAERTIAIPRVHDACFGTPDLFALDRARRILWIFDAKFGHRYVDPFENWQLLTYLPGVLDFFGLNGMDDQTLEVRFRIIQPRSWHAEGPKREWRFIAADERGNINKISGAAHRAMGNNAELVVGPHCRDCPARHACPALQAAAYRAADQGQKVIARELNAHEVGLELYFLEQAQAELSARISGLQAQGLALLRQGQRVPFHRVDHAALHEVWSADAKAVEALGKMLNVDVMETKPKKPAAVRKLLSAAGIDASVINHYAKRPTGEARLASENTNDVRKVFSK